jgi:hypothetical protein
VVQAKTGHRVQLPLLKEVGWAVIDYIRHGRPVCDCPQVFCGTSLRSGPFSEPGPSASDPGQARPGGARAGERETPSRHALAPAYAGHQLMETAHQVEQIADILGHQSVQSTGVYLKSSLGLLAKCALDPDAPARQATR